VTQVLLASRNRAKLDELRRILAPLVPEVEVLGLDDVPAYDEPAETEPTFENNALIKARVAVATTGLASLADDSGICVDALNGMPGVLSARWSGVEKDNKRNNDLLLAQLRDVPDERRGAYFACAVAFCLPSGEEHVTTAKMHGVVIHEPRGSGGFGYDPLFVPSGYNRTTAELTVAQKDEISHRGKALRAIAPLMAAKLRAARS
jgi:XTP/dITP diphosphohydrolase